jgi:hypothetical protein
MRRAQKPFERGVCRLTNMSDCFEMRCHSDPFAVIPTPSLSFRPLRCHPERSEGSRSASSA